MNEASKPRTHGMGTLAPVAGSIGNAAVADLLTEIPRKGAVNMMRRLRANHLPGSRMPTQRRWVAEMHVVGPTHVPCLKIPGIARLGGCCVWGLVRCSGIWRGPSRGGLARTKC